MKLLMHILKKNIRLGIDNETLPLSEISKKLQEEFELVLKLILKNKILEQWEER